MPSNLTSNMSVVIGSALAFPPTSIWTFLPSLSRTGFSSTTLSSSDPPSIDILAHFSHSRSPHSSISQGVRVRVPFLPSTLPGSANPSFVQSGSPVKLQALKALSNSISSEHVNCIPSLVVNRYTFINSSQSSSMHIVKKTSRTPLLMSNLITPEVEYISSCDSSHKETSLV